MITSGNPTVDVVSDFRVRTVGELELLDRLLHQLVLLALCAPEELACMGWGGRGVNDGLRHQLLLLALFTPEQ